MCIAMRQPAPDAQVRDGLFKDLPEDVGRGGCRRGHAATGGLSEKGGLLWQPIALIMVSRMPAYQWWSAHVCKKEVGELRTVALKVSSTATYVMPVSCH